MRVRGLSRLSALLAVLAALTAAFLAPAAASTDTTQETRRLTIIRINCDDEAETFSDEINLYVGGNWWGGRTNMDGGDWWDVRSSVDFNDAIYVELWENDGWQIGGHWVSVSDAGHGEITVHWPGWHGTNYYYRLLYYVE